LNGQNRHFLREARDGETVGLLIRRRKGQSDALGREALTVLKGGEDGKSVESKRTLNAKD